MYFNYYTYSVMHPASITLSDTLFKSLCNTIGLVMLTFFNKSKRLFTSEPLIPKLNKLYATTHPPLKTQIFHYTIKPPFYCDFCFIIHNR